MRSGFGCGVPPDPPTDPSQSGMGEAGRYPPRGFPSLPGLFPKDEGRRTIPGGGVTGEGNNPDKPPDPFCASPRAGYTCDPGVG